MDKWVSDRGAPWLVVYASASEVFQTRSLSEMLMLQLNLSLDSTCLRLYPLATIMTHAPTFTLGESGVRSESSEAAFEHRF